MEMRLRRRENVQKGLHRVSPDRVGQGRPIGSGKGARSGSQRTWQQHVLKARPMTSGHLARSGGTTKCDTGNVRSVGTRGSCNL